MEFYVYKGFISNYLIFGLASSSFLGVATALFAERETGHWTPRLGTNPSGFVLNFANSRIRGDADADLAGDDTLKN